MNVNIRFGKHRRVDSVFAAAALDKTDCSAGRLLHYVAHHSREQNIALALEKRNVDGKRSSSHRRPRKSRCGAYFVGCVKLVFLKLFHSEIIRKIVFMVAMVTVVISAGMLINTYFIQPNIVENDIKDIQPEEKLPWDEIKAKYPDVDFPEGMQLKYAEAYAQNTDLVGWLKISKLKMDFPILQTDNDSYYLKRSFTHRYTDLGNPFLACENSVKTLDRNSIIYGHSTRASDKIFSKLFDYRTTRGFINNPIIEFNTIYHDYKWKVYAVFITNATTAEDNGYFFNYIWRNISEDSFKQYVKELDSRKLYTTGVDIKSTDRILTLSTCLYEFDNARLVVVARMMREGESEKIDTSLVKTNPNPRYPQAWYDKLNKQNPYKNANRWYPN